MMASSQPDASPTDPRVVVRAARWPYDVDAVRVLFAEHAAAIDIDLGFQDFDGEVRDLPGKYAPPAGALFIAWRGEEAVGCVALRPLDATTCEMKRLYVKPVSRGERTGARLVEQIIRAARDAGYARMLLDTLPTMTTAIGMYRRAGFVSTAPYQFSPVEGTVYLSLDLSRPSAGRYFAADVM